MARILIVDDSLMMRKTLRNFLEKAGHEIVGEALNGEQAILSYSKCQPELVTMDITMPGLGGIEAIRRIIQVDPAANIVVVSSLGQKHIIFDAIQNGAKNFILKPITEQKLIPVIDLVMEYSSVAASSN
ncbi:two-component system chemotaxis response regulator CheY [Sporomusaceae bacterium BoRhaA]|uniref:response regulator n=1 Tax=Pelorhabdus rhamnosifermentans TaxID=2772457 RepID=UPI001C0611AD|nr:response regulator [Pelorhabdus rhamnosifermentans]MBU2701431.1 two-component system chemotaxis response regulator CheY [Pelorhabdus rhamnosifermentans]